MAGGGVRNPFTEKEDAHLVEYLAKHNPTSGGRLGQKIYQALEEKDGKEWAWARYHTWQSWRERYKKNQESFDRKIRRYQKDKQKTKRNRVPESDEGLDQQEGSCTRIAADIQVPRPTERDSFAGPDTTKVGSVAHRKTTKTSYTPSDDERLVNYIALSNPSVEGRLGNKIYQSLVENQDDLWPWAKRHPWQSWRERYKTNQEEFDQSIRKYLKRKAATTGDEPKANKDEDKSTHVEDNQKSKRAPDKTKRVEIATVDKSSKPLNAHHQPSHAALKETRKENIPAPKGAQLQLEADKSDLRHRSMEDSTILSPVNGIRAEVPKVANTEIKFTDARQPSVSAMEALVDDEVVADSQLEDGDAEHDALMYDLFGSDPEETEDDEDELQMDEDPQIRQVAVSRNSRPLKAEPTTVPTAAAVSIPHITSPKFAPPRAKPKSKQRRRINDGEDFFQSSPSPSPSPVQQYITKQPAAVPKSRGDPPRLVEGAFRTTLKRGRSRDDDADEVWPPKRAKKNPPSNGSKPADMMQVGDSDKEVAPAKQEPPKAAAPPAKKSNVTSSRPPVPQQNAIASSSKVQLPDSPIHHAQQPLAASPPEPAPPKEADSSVVVQKLKPTVTKILATRPASPEHNKGERKLAMPRGEFAKTIPEGAISDNDVFKISRPLSAKAKGKARAEYVLDTRPPRIDLHRHSLQRRLNNTSTSSLRKSASSSRTSSISASSMHDRRARVSLSGVSLPAASVTTLAEQMIAILSRIALQYSVTDEVALATFLSMGSLERTQVVLMGRQYGVADEDALSIFLKVQTLEKTQVVLMGRHYGVTEAIALATFSKWGTLERTQIVLERYHKAMFEAELAMSEELSVGPVSANGHESQSDEAPSGLVPRQAAKDGDDARRHSRHSRGSRGRKSLTIRPLPDAEEEVLSDYTPPTGSRAGQYARLEKQGRTEEAKERELRHISFPPTQEPPSLSVSPTPQAWIQSQAQMLGESMDVDTQYEIVGKYKGVEFENAAEDDDIRNEDERWTPVFNVDEERQEYSKPEEEEEAEEEEEEEEEEESGPEKEEEASEPEEEAQGQRIEGVGVKAEEVEKAITNVEQDDDGDIYMPEDPYSEVEADDEEPDHPKDDRLNDVLTSPPYPSTRTLLKRVSGGRERDPAFVTLSEDHRRLALSVKAEADRDLRSFEAKNNPDLLRLWSIKWANEMMETYARNKEAQVEIIEVSD